jgi:pseudouridine-5'-phosphate glycosidase
LSPRVILGINDAASPEEVAAVLATIAVIDQQLAAGVEEEAAPALSQWVVMSRLSARRSAMQRGAYKLSGRLPRRSHA